MINFFAKSVAATYIWKRYRKLIVSTAVLFLIYFLTNALHQDYLEYRSLSGGDGDLSVSYLIKWTVLISATVIYYFTNIHKRRLRQDPPPKSNRSTRNKSVTDEETCSAYQPDPFARIRQKDTLNSHVDRELKKK